eukprot:GHVU01053555.1.p1 GENE.GHVU01053555.1~~GHVU01053555.1.p1  ORF type:complete len:109 (+),score=12.01 GHVU01053555.1:286-612(+)
MISLQLQRRNRNATQNHMSSPLGSRVCLSVSAIPLNALAGSKTFNHSLTPSLGSLTHSRTNESNQQGPWNPTRSQRANPGRVVHTYIHTKECCCWDSSSSSSSYYYCY